MGMVVCVAVEEEEWTPNRCAVTINHDFVDHDMSRTTGGGAGYREALLICWSYRYLVAWIERKGSR